MMTEVIESWMTRASLSISLVIVLMIIAKNHGNKTFDENFTKLPSQLKIWSTIIFISCPTCIIILIMRKVPLVCQYIYPLTIPAICYPHIFLTFYQLSRLQLAFSMNAPNISKSHIYPKWLFNVLYLIGIFLLIASISYTWFTMEMVALPYNAGCVFIGNVYFTICSGICAAIYFLWDWFCVGLYIYKLYEFKRDIRGNNTKAIDVIQQIHMILNKILFLTIISEISVIFSIIPDIFRLMFPWIGSIGYAIDNAIIALTIYLMLEHNHHSYFKLLTIMAKIGCLKCCCCCFGDLPAKMDRAFNIRRIKTNSNRNRMDSNDVRNDTCKSTKKSTVEVQIGNHKGSICLSQETDTNMCNVTNV